MIRPDESAFLARGRLTVAGDSFSTMKSLVLSLFGILALSLSACAPVTPEKKSVLPPPAAPLPESDDLKIIRDLEGRLKRDPEDFVAANKLVGHYLQRLRETGDLTYVTLASKTARSSLDTLPADRNPGGLAAMAQAEFAGHEFTAARDHALKLIEIDPSKPGGFQILGDACLELGEYEKAAEAFEKMRKAAGTTSSARSGVAQRFARLAALRGDLELARTKLVEALESARVQPVPQRETVAWCYWQIGETEFVRGNYPEAEKNFRDSLTTFPDYYRALAGLGRARAAQGDLPGAIAGFERVVRILPDPSFVAILGDLYKTAGREKDAAAQFALVEGIGRLSKLNGVLYNRQLARFYADHDMKPDEAYSMAKAEYEVRKDVYGADTLAWAALKAGKLPEAKAAIREALRLGTADASFFYHAGMIALAAGEKESGREFLQKALKASPRFDVLQDVKARQALDGKSP